MTAVLPVSEAKQHLGALVDRAHFKHEPVWLSRRGERVAVLVDADDFEALVQRAEDLEDAEAAEAARREMTETGAAPVPWDEVRAELGLL